MSGRGRTPVLVPVLEDEAEALAWDRQLARLDAMTPMQRAGWHLEHGADVRSVAQLIPEFAASVGIDVGKLERTCSCSWCGCDPEEHGRPPLHVVPPAPAAPHHQEPAEGDFAALADWGLWLRAKGTSETTIHQYAYGLFRFMRARELRSFGAATEDDVATFVSGIGDRSTAKAMYFRGVRSFFSWAARRGLVGEDPTAEIPMRRPLPRRSKVALSLEELTRIIYAAAVRDPRRAWTLLLSYSLGTRRMEVANIRPREVDVDGRRVRLHRTKGDRPRVVPLSALALSALEGLRPWWTEESVVGAVVPQTITEWAQDAARDAGLADRVAGRPSHVLRASFITHMLNAGAPVHVVRDLVGHRSIAMTNEYAVASGGQGQEALDRVFPGPEGRRPAD